MVANGKLLIDNSKHAVVCALGNATIPEGITTIGSNAFCNRPELVNYTIPEGVTTLTKTNGSESNIGNNTFSQCANLESIVIPEGIKVISSSAFTECPKLNSATIPSSVEKIEFNAFGNTGLTEITIPANVTYIASQAFSHNQNLTTVISYTRAGGSDVFDGVDKNTCILYVPEGSVDAYKAAPVWKDFKHILPIKTSTRIYGIESDGELFDVYSLSGQKVKSKATSLDGLPHGIYIINGKKVMK